MKAIISEKALEAIKEESGLHPNEETGGMLIGKEVNDEIFIVDFIGPGPNALHSPGGFSYDPEYELREYKKIIEDNHNIELQGWIHKHPGNFDRPSGADLHQVNQFFNAEEWQEWKFNILLMPIVTIGKNGIEITAYVITKENRKFERIPLEIVPESHPAIQALLGKKEASEPETQKPVSASNRMDAEIKSLEKLGLKVSLRYNEIAKLVIISATLEKRPSLLYRNISFDYKFKLEFRLHRSYPLTRPAVFLTVRNRREAVSDQSRILKNWSPAYYLAHIVHFDFPNLIYPIKPFRRSYGSPDF